MADGQPSVRQGHRGCALDPAAARVRHAIDHGETAPDEHPAIALHSDRRDEGRRGERIRKEEGIPTADPGKAVLKAAVAQVTVPDTRPPDGAWPVAAVDGNLVFQREGELFVWDPATGREIDRLPGQLPVAWQGSLLAWCDGACRSLHLADLASGARLEAELPAGATGFEALRGAFSPDDGTLAVAVRLGDGENAERQLALVDVRTGQLTLPERGR